jgi:hypothetical protein
MAEKHVSVRLGATGGRQVRAELEGVGEAGKRGFGRLSQEMEAANRRLAGFARRVRVASAAAVAAATAAGVAMVRSGLQTVDAQAKLAASLDTTVASIQVLERAAELSGARFSEIEGGASRLTRRLSLFASDGGGPAAKAIEQLGLNAEDLLRLPLDERIDAVTRSIRENAGASEQAALFSQLFGDRAFVAFQRLDTATLAQANQDLRDFGAIVSDQDAAQIERTNDAISRLGLVWRGLSNQLAVAAAPALEAIADAMAAAARTTGPLGQAIQGLFGNLGRLAGTAAAFAGFLAGRWVAGLAAAALSVRGLATALVVLRGALIRTGIGALIVGAGELIYQFGRLVSGAGSFGAAMRLLRGVAVEVWDRIRTAAAAAGAAATATFFDLKADAAAAMQSAIESVVGFGNTAVNTFEGAYEAIKTIWGRLPAAIGDLAFQAANSLVDGVEAMLNGVVSRINGFIGGLNSGLEALGSERRLSVIPDLELGEIENRFEGAATAASSAARDAFDRAFEDNPLIAPDLGLTGAATEALGSANTYRGVARDLAESARAPLESWQALRDAVRGSEEDGSDALTEASKAAERFETALGEAGQAAGAAGAAAGAAAATAAPDTEAAVNGWKAVTSALSDYASKAHSISGDIGNALVGAFQSAETAVGTFVKTGKLNFRDLVSSLLADLAQLAARRFILGPIANALSGALGGAGGIFADGLHAGGVVGSAGPARMVPAMAFADAPRMHAGGMAGLRADEVPAILQRGERVLSRAEARDYDGPGRREPNVTVNIMTRDAESFRQSRTQVAADISRAVALGRRGL